MTPFTPLQVKFALIVAGTSDPEQFGAEHWNSPAGEAVQNWLVDEELATETTGGWRATDKLRAWVDHLCSQPLPESQWIVPTADERET